MEPSLCEPEFAIDLGRGDLAAEGFGALLGGHAPEETHFDQLGLAGVVGGQAVQGFVNGEHLFGVLVEREDFFFQFEVGHAGAAFLRTFGAGIVDDDLAHHPRGKSEEVGPVVDRLLASLNQLDVGLVDECGSLNGLLLAAQVGVGEAAELVIDERHQKIDGTLIALTGAFEQQSYLVGIHRTIMRPGGDRFQRIGCRIYVYSGGELMLRAFGRMIGLAVGFVFWGLIALLVAVMLLGSFWLDGVGVEQTARVAAKHEKITFRYASWTRICEIGLQREDGPMAEVRRAMVEKHDGQPDLVGIETVRVPIDVYDRYHVGQTVKVLVQPPGFFKDWVIFPQVRLAGVSTALIAYSVYESAWPLPQFLLSLLPAAYLGWLASRGSKWLWLACGFLTLTALGYWLSPLSDRRPEGEMRATEGKVVALRLVEEVGETEESAGFEALVPHWVVGVEFTPEGWRSPVVAVDRVDAPSIQLKEGEKVRLEYQVSDPRRALLVSGERRWWWMNLMTIGQYVAMFGGLLLALWLTGRFFRGLRSMRQA